jgi:hypothetical protein
MVDTLQRRRLRVTRKIPRDRGQRCALDSQLSCFYVVSRLNIHSSLLQYPTMSDEDPKDTDSVTDTREEDVLSAGLIVGHDVLALPEIRELPKKR